MKETNIQKKKKTILGESRKFVYISSSYWRYETAAVELIRGR